MVETRYNMCADRGTQESQCGLEKAKSSEKEGSRGGGWRGGEPLSALCIAGEMPVSIAVWGWNIIVV